MLINADAFAGRVALVTGASRGIGAAVAKKLTEAGAFVVGTATSEKGAETVSAALGEKGRGIVLNVTDRAACAEAVNAVVTEFGRIDILVNNAGITRDMLAMRLSDEDWDAVIATNLTSVFTMTRACLHILLPQLLLRELPQQLFFMRLRCYVSGQFSGSWSIYFYREQRYVFY